MAISTNAVLNATLALIRGDMSVVRSLLRAPGNDQQDDIPKIVTAVYEALEGVKQRAIRDLRITASKEALAKELIGIQIEALEIEPVGDNENERKCYMAGVERMETLLNNRIIEMTRIVQD
jgi:hypothetical protein